MTIVRAILSAFLLAAASITPVAEASPRAWQPKAGDVISFDVLRGGKPFGSHAVQFEEGPDGTLLARTRISLKAGLGPLTLFRYQLNSTETWLDGELLEVTGDLNDDGKKGVVNATRQGDALAVTSTQFNGVAPAGTMPGSHWNFAQTGASKLLSTGNGELLNLNVVNKGREAIRAGDTTIEANRYLLESNFDADVWYDDEGRWVKLAFTVRGEDIEYVLNKLY